MPILARKNGNSVSLEVSGEFPAPLSQGQIPSRDLKSELQLSITLDATFSDGSAAIQVHNAIARREAPSLAHVLNARGLALYVAAAADAVTVAEGAMVTFDYLPDTGAARDVIVTKLAKRLGEDESTIIGWFRACKSLSAREAAALFARPSGMNARALLNRDGSVSPEKVFAKWNAPKG